MSYSWGLVGLNELCMGIRGVSYVIRGGIEVNGSVSVGVDESTLTS